MKSALLIIDVQRGLFENAPHPDDASGVITRINELSSRARHAGVPVVFIQHERANSVLAHGSENWQLDPRLALSGGDIVVRKTTPDSFLRTTLGDVLAQHGVDHLVISGYATEFCVDTTTRRAAALGFPVTLVADAHTTHDKSHASAAQIRAHHTATLPSLTSFGPAIKAVPAAEVSFDLD